MSRSVMGSSRRWLCRAAGRLLADPTASRRSRVQHTAPRGRERDTTSPRVTPTSQAATACHIRWVPQGSNQRPLLNSLCPVAPERILLLPQSEPCRLVRDAATAPLHEAHGDTGVVADEAGGPEVSP